MNVPRLGSSHRQGSKILVDRSPEPRQPIAGSGLESLELGPPNPRSVQIGETDTADIKAQRMDLTLGTRLGPYEILSPLGTGGMGRVYRARDVNLNRPVAIKVLHDDSA